MIEYRALLEYRLPHAMQTMDNKTACVFVDEIVDFFVNRDGLTVINLRQKDRILLTLDSPEMLKDKINRAQRGC